MAAIAGWRGARVETGEGPVLLTDPDGLTPEARGKEGPGESLVVVVRAAGVELFRRLNRVDGDAPDATPVELVPSAKLETDLSRILSGLCTSSLSCASGVLFVEGAADLSLVGRTLELLARAASSSAERPSEFELRGAEPGPPAAPMRVAAVAGQTDIKGRLPPVHIQQVVRANFDQFRKCYEAGLGRDPTLQGRVVARFVIGRDGAVSNVANGGSSMPDPEVVKCVLTSFYELRFEPPLNGIVTIIYPIQLEPG